MILRTQKNPPPPPCGETNSVSKGIKITYLMMYPPHHQRDHFCELIIYRGYIILGEVTLFHTPELA